MRVRYSVRQPLHKQMAAHTAFPAAADARNDLDPGIPARRQQTVNIQFAFDFGISFSSDYSRLYRKSVLRTYSIPHIRQNMPDFPDS